MYYKNGDREMGDYYNGNSKGKYAMHTNNGEAKINHY